MDRGSACGPDCGYCGGCTSGPKIVGRCTRCDGPYFTMENTISGLCDVCLDRDHDEVRIARETRCR